MDKIKFLSFLFFIFTISITANGQDKEIKGQVLDIHSQPLPGVSVSIKGTTQGVVSDVNGDFNIKVEPGKILVFSFIGYQTNELLVGNESVLRVLLNEESKNLDEVVVTAMGIKRSEKSLTYATQGVSGKDLTEVASPNLLNSLAGKTSGVMVSSSASGVGGSVKVVIRGNRSIQGNNQPLYVVDGLPITNSTPSSVESGNGFGGGNDAGDGISQLNPDDIESMQVLKGASAASLYGSQAANGVILITTKKGKKGTTSISINSSTQFDIPNVMYDFQESYAASGTTGWGVMETTDRGYKKDFYRVGSSLINSVSISSGNESLQNFISYANTKAVGIVPNHELNKHNLSLRSTTSFLSKIIEVDSRINLTTQKTDDAPSAPGEYYNPIFGTYLFPYSTERFNYYKTNYEIYDPNRNMMTQNWYAGASNSDQNPYWILNRNQNRIKNDRLIAKTDITFNLLTWLNLKLRGSYDQQLYNYRREIYAGSNLVLASANGGYSQNNQNNITKYGDILLNIKKDIQKLSINSTLGASYDHSNWVGNSFDSVTKGLYFPNVFSLTNMVGGGQYRYEWDGNSEMQSVFGTINLGYDDVAYLDITGRNDWSSTLPEKNNSFFYPSLGGSIIVTNLLKKLVTVPSYIDFGKLRASWTQVGNTVPSGLTHPLNSVTPEGNLQVNTTKPFTDLEPEKSTSIELGMDLRFLGRLTLDVAYYKTNTKNQYFAVAAPVGTGYSTYYINAGEIQNQGVEVSFGASIIKKKDITWETNVNFSANKNKVISLPSAYKENGFTLYSVGYQFRIEEGKEYGEMYASKFKRDKKNRVIVDSLGTPQIDSKLQHIGSINPDFMLSWKNDISYKNFYVSILIDGRFGGTVVSVTQAKLNASGLSQKSANDRNNNGVVVDAALENGTPYTNKIDAKTWNTLSPIGECAVYSATNIRIRELSIGYNLPKNLINRLYINSAKISLTARNLLFLMIDAPYDPELTMSTGNGLSNSDNFGLPATKTLGFNVNINF